MTRLTLALIILFLLIPSPAQAEWPYDQFNCKAWRADLYWRDWARRHCPGYRWRYHRRYRHVHRAPQPDADVMRYQLLLRERGFDIEADGLMGPDTREALRRFQEAHDLEPTGTLGPRTKRALRRSQRDLEGNDDDRDHEPRRCLEDHVAAYSSENVFQGSDSKEASKREAKDRWSAVVRAERGEIYMNWDDAADRYSRCWQSSTGERFTEKAAERVGRVHWRCKVEARPCETPAKKPEGETETERYSYGPERHNGGHQ